MKSNSAFRITVLCFLLATSWSYGQDSLKIKQFLPKKNVVRYNITPHIVGFKSAIFGYERVVKPFQTFSINGGYIGIGKSGTTKNEAYEITKIKSNGGFTIAGDYRFYLKRENKDPAPHGVYIGPYYAYYNFRHNNQLQQLSSGDEASIDTNFKISSLGLELGYQFVIKNRFTIDMVFIGPSYSGYKLKLAFAGNLNIPE